LTDALAQARTAFHPEDLGLVPGLPPDVIDQARHAAIFIPE